MINEISDYLYSFKNKVMEAEDIVKTCEDKILNYSMYLEEQGFKKDYEENFFTILGYSYRLEDNKQRLFYTFQEAIYAIDLDKLMRNEDSLKLNTIVYILVLNLIIKEYKTSEVNQLEKRKALDTYKIVQQRQAKENQKYHMYQN
ncbi:hypothetical protein [Poseidonibacter ostreae]|jgi:hypothetical protein|uniref:Uncharacterized protein n=1 Tax=Poseidonibacter ostreae TaxID=2654171 RepID=A0A6L4WQS7_9BACT|nr:hypothetical protein [Poseidonibacter ostreae]KAB7887254.1 hypothetical protein GBG19_10980 [Poseidonibacter ostreae]KAB7888311.1 hypothetical protein GA417_00605 [Poseidonibacter ostreae]KAB7889525.1 hypothetical protein GBG18_10885 [Poseidonibacter ostreae]MAC82919.1 hypothetical protein [Arcobacter sp.]|tara:strand:- start:2732 stop:3166 length:435 start_codon:yes stop_codon:yes gene_type:complete